MTQHFSSDREALKNYRATIVFTAAKATISSFCLFTTTQLFIVEREKSFPKIIPEALN
jgi:hypothetical protein